MADQDAPAHRNGDPLADQDAGAYGGPAYRNAHALTHSHTSDRHAHTLACTLANPDLDGYVFSRRFAFPDTSAHLPADGYASPHRDNHTFSPGHSLSNALAHLPADRYAFTGSLAHKNALATSHGSLLVPIALGYRCHCANCFALADPYFFSYTNDGPVNGGPGGFSTTFGDPVFDGDEKAGLAHRHSIAWRVAPVGRSIGR